MFLDCPVFHNHNFYMEKILAQNFTFPGGTTAEGTITVTGPVSMATDIGTILVKAIPYIFAAAGIGLLLMIIAAGFGLLSSAGDPKKTEGAKQRITNALLGFVIIFVAYWLVQIAGKIFGITEIGTSFQ
jgi:hypothetical protein